MKSEFGVDAAVIPMFTYWVPSTMSVVDEVRSLPVAFTMDKDFSNYKVIRCVDKRVNLFVEFTDVNSYNDVHGPNMIEPYR